MMKPTALTDEEKRVVKALLADGRRNQDIHARINYERCATVNFGRIASIKKNPNIIPASKEEVAFFQRKKHSFDPVNGLNLYSDERVIRGHDPCGDDIQQRHLSVQNRSVCRPCEYSLDLSSA
jgi:hypothetical protein